VLVPCYNDGGLLLEALASIEEPEPVEVIVVDDGSHEPETLAVLARLVREETRVIRHGQNRGLVEARNSGLRQTRTPYVFPLDSDDLAVPGAITAMADVLDRDPDVAVCFGDYLEFGDYELVRAVPDRLDAFRLAYVNEYPVSALLRSSVVLSIGGWRDPAAYGDWDLWLALAERENCGIHLGAGRLTFRKRIHGGRMLAAAKTLHPSLYRQIQEQHPRVFGDIRHHRRASDLPKHRKLLYPIVYGGRRRFVFERHFKQWLDRRRIWTLRR
jgi:glycosyltransferase involved in cell wall biosynthesis